jgi:transcriptional regulator with XRE-family HTH domain
MEAAHTALIPVWTLGDRLRKAREVAGMDAEIMAQHVGVTDRTIRNYETDTTPVKRSVILGYSMATGVPVEWIETGVTPPSDPTLVTRWYAVCSGSPPDRKTVLRLAQAPVAA